MAAEERANVPPATLPVNPDGIPDDLNPYPQGVCWDWEYRGDKWTKPPLRANGRGYAKSTDPTTWATLPDALATYQRRDLAGVGFALTKDDPFAFVDLDHCRDPETGEVAPWAKPIIRQFRHTYHEVSPTGTGIKVLLRGRLPGSQHTKPVGAGKAKVELFDAAKYTTLTGHRCEGSPAGIADAQAALDALYAELFPDNAEQTARQGPTDIPDDDDRVRLEQARAAKNGAAFSRLFDSGDTIGYGGDDSRADQALCNMLAFWFGPDRARVDRVFRQSALMRPKWDRRHHGDGRTYGEGTVDKALAGRTEFYAPRGSFRVFAGGRSGSPLPESDATTPPPTDGDDTRPTINAGDQNLERVSAEAWTALEAANDPPQLFCFGRVPVRVEGGEHGMAPVAQTLTEDRLRHQLARAAIWFKATKEGELKSASPPVAVVRDMLAAPSYPLPPLLSIVQTPVFAPDGSLQTEPGYHSAGKTFYAPIPGFVVPRVPDAPDVATLAEAKGLILNELLGEFPFVDENERANAVALFLDPYVRNLIDGPTPLRLIEAPIAGSGKGLLADVVLRPAVGQRINVMPAANDDDEWRKRITAQLMLLPAAILIDNITTALDSGALSSAMTANWWTDRRLGANEMVHVPVRCSWLATANNPTMSTELARRTVRIRLDPHMDRPWRRSGFKHEDLRSWVDANRARLVWAGLVLVRHWRLEGAPLGTVRLGSFERWAAVLGGILDANRIGGFLGNLEAFYETADLEGAIWRQFVALWAEQHGENEVGAADLFTLALKVEGFDFGKGSERAQRTSFGHQLTKQRDRVVGDYRIVQTRVVHSAKRWRLLGVRSDNPFATFYDAAGTDDGAAS